MPHLVIYMSAVWCMPLHIFDVSVIGCVVHSCVFCHARMRRPTHIATHTDHAAYDVSYDLLIRSRSNWCHVHGIADLPYSLLPDEAVR